MKIGIPKREKKKTLESGPGTIRLSDKKDADWSLKGTGISESGPRVISSLKKNLDQTLIIARGMNLRRNRGL